MSLTRAGRVARPFEPLARRRLDTSAVLERGPTKSSGHGWPIGGAVREVLGKRCRALAVFVHQPAVEATARTATEQLRREQHEAAEGRIACAQRRREMFLAIEH